VIPGIYAYKDSGHCDPSNDGTAPRFRILF